MLSSDLPPFGVLLKRHRLAAGLTHEALAERAGVSARTISDLERGVARGPRRDTLALLAAALDLAPAERDLLATAARAVGSVDPPIPASALPPHFTSFVGRERETRALRALLVRSGIRLVTVSGAGGAGKTRLALHVAESLTTTFPDGLVFVSLAPVGESGDVAVAVAQALGLDVGSSPTTEVSIVRYLRHRRALLVLDNFEHLLDGTSFLVDLLGGCPGLTLLVTSRATLRLSAERDFPVGPLPVPDLDRLPSVRSLHDYDSVALFVDRARRARPDFRLTQDNAAAVAAICARLDGLPLAIELAAARITLLSPRALLTRLDGAAGAALDLLTRSTRDLPPRQRTLRDTIAWSHDLLSPGEQALFRRLAVFAGGCDLAAIEAIGSEAPPNRRDGPVFHDPPALDGVASLLDNSLLYRDEGPDGEARIGMLEMIRAFALERLAASGEEQTIRARHARHYLEMVESAGAVLVGASHQPARLAADRDNIRAALRWLVEAG